jgi:hypothetical protein
MKRGVLTYCQENVRKDFDKSQSTMVSGLKMRSLDMTRCGLVARKEKALTVLMVDMEWERCK